MKKFGLFTAAFVMAAFMAASAWAGNEAPKGPHYNLNIIGVENPKNAKMSTSKRHTIFMPLVASKVNGKISTCKALDDVPLSGSCTAIVDNVIWLVPGEDFQVCDGNGFDDSYLCDGTLLSTKDGAVFSLPCNENLTNADLNFGCDPTKPMAHYQVWIRALGKPGGSAQITTCADVGVLGSDNDGGTVDGGGDLYCSLETVTDDLVRNNGKPIFHDVTSELTSLLLEYCKSGFFNGGECDGPIKSVRVALFASGTQDWFWNYDNKGLRLAQIRFYLTSDIKG